MRVLILGNGYIAKRCATAWPDAVHDPAKIYAQADIAALLEKHTPDAVLNAAGVRGKPNVDWCETHEMETMFGNVVLPILVAQSCQEKNIYLLHVGSGCIFYGDSPHPDKAWRENDFGNPSAVYSKSKYAADLALSALPNVGIARIRMPLDSRPTPGNIIDKLVQYEKVFDVKNSLTVIPDMVEVLYQLLSKKAAGIFHVTNPGVISHRDILSLYEKYVAPLPPKDWVREEDQVRAGLVEKRRSTNTLVSERLKEYGIAMRPVLEAVEDAMKKYATLTR